MGLYHSIGLENRHRVVPRISSSSDIILLLVVEALLLVGVLPLLPAVLKAGEGYLMSGHPKSDVVHDAVVERLKYF